MSTKNIDSKAWYWFAVNSLERPDSEPRKLPCLVKASLWNEKMIWEITDKDGKRENIAAFVYVKSAEAAGEDLLDMAVNAALEKLKRLVGCDLKAQLLGMTYDAKPPED